MKLKEQFEKILEQPITDKQYKNLKTYIAKLVDEQVESHFE